MIITERKILILDLFNFELENGENHDDLGSKRFETPVPAVTVRARLLTPLCRLRQKKIGID